jgi:hypothetical protein
MKEDNMIIKNNITFNEYKQPYFYVFSNLMNTYSTIHYMIVRKDNTSI